MSTTVMIEDHERVAMGSDKWPQKLVGVSVAAIVVLNMAENINSMWGQDTNAEGLMSA